MSLPRKSEFDDNVVSNNARIAGAACWAYGLFGLNGTEQGFSYPAPYWPGWDSWTPGGAKPGGGTYWAADLVDFEYYYDSCRVFYGLADYTANAQWIGIARKALDAYLTYVENADPTRYALTPPQAGLQAHLILPHGAYLDYVRNTDPTAKARARKAVFALANASWGTSYPQAWLPDLTGAREIGYNLSAKYLAIDAGYASVYGADPWGLTDDAIVGSAYAFCDQAISLLGGGDGGTGLDGNPIVAEHRYVRPFMMANIAIGLIAHFEHTGDSRVLPKLLTLFNALWTVCYRANGTTLSNTLPLDGNNDSGGSQPGPGPGGAAPANDVQYGINGLTYTHADAPPGVTDLSSTTGWGAGRADPAQWQWMYWLGSPQWYPPLGAATWPTPELNGLILPVYFWLYQQTGDATHLARADALFDGLVRVSNLNCRGYGSDTSLAYDNYGKTFNQMWCRIWPYVMTRIHGGALALPGSSGAHAIAGSSGAKALP